jgi:predicted nucleic acid-binding protein
LPDRVLIDTTALLALINRDDALHERTQLAYRELTVARSLLVVTEWVLAEFLNGASAPPLRKPAIELTAHCGRPLASL